MIQNIDPASLRNHYEPDALPHPSDPVFCFDGNELAEKGFSRLPVRSDFDATGLLKDRDFTFLFRIDETPYFLIDITESAVKRASHPEDAAESVLHASLTDAGFSFSTIREIRGHGKLSPELMFAAFTALHLMH